MNPETLAALKASITHWEQMRDDWTISSPGLITCALCERFECGPCIYLDERCPVVEKTGQPRCNGSPYSDAEDAYYALDDKPENPKLLAAWQKAAQKEIDFLKSLLPTNEPPTP